MGNFLRKALAGDIARLPEVKLWQADQRQGGHARKLMEKYQRWLGEGAELSILRLLGLFNRPAEVECLAVLRCEPAIERTRLYQMLFSANSAPLRFQEEDQNAEAQRTRREYLEMAREKLQETKSLVKQTEIPYEPHVPDRDQWEPPEYVGVFKKGQIVGYHCRNDEIDALQDAIDALTSTDHDGG